MRFYYQGKKLTGEIESGEIEALDQKEARAILESQGIFVEFLKETPPSLFEKEIIFERIKEKDLVFFFYQLATLVSAGVPLVEALKVLEAQTKKRILKEKILEITKEVASGKKLSEACQNYPEVFSRYHLSLIKIGEETGRLPETLNLLSNYVEKNYLLKQRLISAILYPALVFFIFVLIVLLIFFVVVPKLEPIFFGYLEKLPLITKIIILLSHFFRENLWFFLALLSFFVVYLYFIFERAKEFFSKAIIFWPKIGENFKKIYLARFAFSLATFQQAGMSILEALTLSSQTVGNEIYKKEIEKLREGVERGYPLSVVLLRNPELFPPIFSQMIAIGEKTGKTREALQKISQFFEQELERTIQDFLTILEPLLILVLAIFVGLIVVGLLLPIYQVIMGAPEVE